MKQVIIFAGTTEGRVLATQLGRQQVHTLACVATEYGQQLIEEQPTLSVHAGRLDVEEMKQLFRAEGNPLVIDATHPYAVIVSENIKKACEDSGAEYLRLIRDSVSENTGADCIVVENVDAAVEYLKSTVGNILVTTGSKELHKFVTLQDYEERVYARVLSTPEVAEQCSRLGFTGKHLICMQGPFSVEMNAAMLNQFKASYLVTKESGTAGGFAEKMEAAAMADAKVVLIGRPPEQEGLSFEKVEELLAQRFSIRPDFVKRQITLVGIGMGSIDNMTLEAMAACKEADCIIGAARMLECVKTFGRPSFAAYDPQIIKCYAEEHPEYKNIVIVLSGDVGFYSGARRLMDVFEDEAYEVQQLCGISSVVYLCSKCKTSWEDVKLISAHGRKGNLIGAVKRNEKTFALLSAKDSVREICEELIQYGLPNVQITVGERLHYPEEKLTNGTPEELRDLEFDGLCVALIHNPEYKSGILSCIDDDDFIRGKAPMTKSEIRSISVSKLKLQERSVIYDIGAGTGSVSIEMALQAVDGQVYAIEKKEEAANLIAENMKKFGTPNIQVVRGLAPEALEELPVPTHAFIGGSSGNLKEIIELLLKKNPGIRLVINAVTLETIGEVVNCLKTLPLTDTDIIQVQVSKAKALGNYQLMMGQNPVYIVACTGGES